MPCLAAFLILVAFGSIGFILIREFVIPLIDILFPKQ